MAAPTDPAIVARVLKLAARGWKVTQIVADCQIGRQTVWRIIRTHRASELGERVATEELAALRKIIAGLYLGTCGTCKGHLVAFRAQGFATCPRCKSTFNAALKPV